MSFQQIQNMYIFKKHWRMINWATESMPNLNSANRMVKLEIYHHSFLSVLSTVIITKAEKTQNSDFQCYSTKYQWKHTTGFQLLMTKKPLINQSIISKHATEWCNQEYSGMQPSSPDLSMNKTMF